MNKSKYFFILIALIFNAIGDQLSAVCPGYGSEGGQDDLTIKEYLHYGYHIHINLTGEKQNDQHVNFVYIDTISNKIITRGEVENNQISFDDLTISAPMHPKTDTTKFTDKKNRKLIIWGLDYRGLKVGTEVDLALSLDNIGLEEHDDIVPSLFGLNGNYSYEYKVNTLSGFTIEQDNDSQFQQAGCGQILFPVGSFGHYSFIGNLNPKLIINVTGNLQYKLSQFTDYQLGWKTVNNSYKLITTKTSQTN